MNRFRPRIALVLAAQCCAARSIATAQGTSTLAGERARLAEITGDTAVAPRVDSRLAAWVPALRHVRGLADSALQVAGPSVRVTYNSTIPYSLNDGGLWAGRGWSVSVGGGLAWEGREPYGRARVVVAPELYYSQNLPFQVFPNTEAGRSPWASPFHGRAAPADVPLRFGDRYVLRVAPGQSELSFSTRRLRVGASTTNEVWGPGIRNALIVSDNAAGVPRAFVRTAQPLRTRAGTVDVELFAGTLTKSLFFDTARGGGFRSLSAVNVIVRPAFDTTLTLGFSRVVYARIDAPLGGTMSHALDALARWEYLPGVADTNAVGDPNQSSEQMAAVSARWIVPRSGFEVYGEWARMDLPRSATELLTAPNHTLGYTVGFQWAQPRRQHDLLRLQSEITSLEQSLVFPARPPHDFYASSAVPQGYTQRGQVIGAAIGPGASSQWLAVDYLGARWQAGWFAGRIRWDNDALYRVKAPNFFRHDVSLLSGVRGAWRGARTDFGAELTLARRYNYLFQYGGANPGGLGTVDVSNLTLALTAIPR